MRSGKAKPRCCHAVIASDVSAEARRAKAEAKQSIYPKDSMDCFVACAPRSNDEERSGALAAPRQPPHHLVELLEVAVADLHAAAGVAMVDADVEPERIGDALLERDGVGVLGLTAAGGARLLRLALRHALFMRQRLGLPHVEPLLDDLLGGSERIGHADQRARVT